MLRVCPSPSLLSTCWATSHCYRPTADLPSLPCLADCGTYTIQPGDTFWKLSQERGFSVDAILAANPGVTPELLQIGQQVNLPCQGNSRPNQRPANNNPTPLHQQSNSASADGGAVQMYEEMMRYRASAGLPPIPLCKHLNTVASVKVQVMLASPPGNGCNMHSWSQSPRWSGCCYRGGSDGKCMWDKPRELSGYRGNGYEVSCGGSGGLTPKGAIDCWRGSQAHSDVILNRGMWRDSWGAVGVGISGKYAVAWFGKEPCPA